MTLQLPESQRPAALNPGRRSGLAAALGSLSLLLLLALLGIYQLTPPPPLPASAPADDFSAERAYPHVAAIAKAPHPTGSAENQSVRQYLLDQLTQQGLTPVLQTAAAATELWGPYPPATVVNVMARLKGTASTRAVLLMAHYDSASTGPGASDDGQAVALLLETLRALKAGPPLRNDVIFLFTDGEELGTLGARAFVRQHSWAKEVGLVMNWEARGTFGPVFLFETSPGNERLLAEFAREAPYPAANSLTAAIYRMMPNGTDFSNFLAEGVPGLNFAFIDGVQRYHTTQDDLAHLDLRSLQQGGGYGLALARRFGNLSLTNLKAEDAVYFNPVRFALIHYPQSWVWPLNALLSLGFVGTLALGFRRRRLSMKGTSLGLLSLLLTLVAVGVLIWAASSAFRTAAHPGYLYVGCVALAVTAAATTTLLSRRWVRLPEMVAGALLLWLLLLFALSRWLPGASFLAVWPLPFGLGTLLWLLRVAEPESPSAGNWIAFGLLATPPMLLVTPIIYCAFVALPISISLWLALLIVMLLGLLLPHLWYMLTAWRARLPATATAVLALCVAAALTIP